MALPTGNIDRMSIIDERDPSIKYTNAWNKAVGPGLYLNTTTYTPAAGATATVNFTGTDISVYGTIIDARRYKNINPVSNYAIDSGAPCQYNAPQQVTDQNQQMFFRASNLELANHTLVITNIVEGGWLSLDFFLVGNDAAESTTTFPTPSTSASSSLTSGAATVTVTTRVSEKQSGPPIGATVGVGIAGFALICVAFYACFFFRRRRLPKEKPLLLPTKTPPPGLPKASPAQRQHPSAVTPFIIAQPPNQSSTGMAQLNSQVPFPAGGKRQVAESLPSGYTVVPDGTSGRVRVWI